MEVPTGTQATREPDRVQCKSKSDERLNVSSRALRYDQTLLLATCGGSINEYCGSSERWCSWWCSCSSCKLCSEDDDVTVVVVVAFVESPTSSSIIVLSDRNHHSLIVFFFFFWRLLPFQLFDNDDRRRRRLLLLLLLLLLGFVVSLVVPELLCYRWISPLWSESNDLVPYLQLIIYRVEFPQRQPGCKEVFWEVSLSVLWRIFYQ